MEHEVDEIKNEGVPILKVLANPLAKMFQNHDLILHLICYTFTDWRNITEYSIQLKLHLSFTTIIPQHTANEYKDKTKSTVPKVVRLNLKKYNYTMQVL